MYQLHFKFKCNQIKHLQFFFFFFLLNSIISIAYFVIHFYFQQPTTVLISIEIEIYLTLFFSAFSLNNFHVDDTWYKLKKKVKPFPASNSFRLKLKAESLNNLTDEWRKTYKLCKFSYLYMNGNKKKLYDSVLACVFPRDVVL